MAGDPLSVELLQVVARYIHSVEQLEILCIFVETPQKAWTDTEVFKRIQSSEESVRRNLEYFASISFVTGNRESGYSFTATNTELARQAIDLVKVYREKRVAVVEAIYQAPSDPIRDFADAFRIRKDKP